MYKDDYVDPTTRGLVIIVDHAGHKVFLNRAEARQLLLWLYKHLTDELRVQEFQLYGFVVPDDDPSEK